MLVGLRDSFWIPEPRRPGGRPRCQWLELVGLYQRREYLLDVRHSRRCDFVLVAQFPYEVEKRAYTAVKLMSKSQQSMFVDGLNTLDSMDCFTAMVAGVPTQREDPNSPVRAPTCTLLIHDNKEVNIPGISGHPAKDFKWNRFTHEVNEFRPGLVLYKAADPDVNLCVNLFCEA